MNFEVEKVRIDSRFKANNSTSESELNIELARSLEVLDGVAVRVDDTAIPVSWSTIHEGNQNCYHGVSCGADLVIANTAFDLKNYDHYKSAVLTTMYHFRTHTRYKHVR